VLIFVIDTYPNVSVGFSCLELGQRIWLTFLLKQETLWRTALSDVFAPSQSSTSLAMPFFLQGLETEYDACLVTQIALVGVRCESTPETREHKVQLHRPKRDRVRDWDIDATANDEIKSIVAGRPHDNAPRTILLQIGVHVRVCAAEHSFNEGLHVRRTEFSYRPNVVGKKIT
jgi:hypothetical protein